MVKTEFYVMLTSGFAYKYIIPTALYKHKNNNALHFNCIIGSLYPQRIHAAMPREGMFDGAIRCLPFAVAFTMDQKCCQWI